MNLMRPPQRAFTLIELLVVIGIMALIAAIAAPSLRRMRQSDLMAAANRQLLDDLASARQRAIVGHTTVYMLFMPPVPLNHPAAGPPLDDPHEQLLLDHQQTSYALYVQRTVGDQPGQPNESYLTDWRSLPQGVFIPTWKFANAADRFQYATNIPVPKIDSPILLDMPYVAFDYQGRLVLEGLPNTTNEVFVPFARGFVDYQKDAATGLLRWAPPDAVEDPPANSTDPNMFNHIVIDWITGRAKVVRREIAP
jgi:prepilin-type N-terminal cleavage/methylation domain-containing protein